MSAKRASRWFILLVGVFAVWLSSTLLAQLVDNNKAPNAANGGINRALVNGSYPTEVGDGRLGSDQNTSLNVIRFDPFRAIRRGRQLFERKFSRIEGQGPLSNDGFGDIENDSASAPGSQTVVPGATGDHAAQPGSAATWPRDPTAGTPRIYSASA